MSYNKIFKSTLRQDPDMLVLSEIRDSEALQTAIQASLSGTIVIATIHASNVIELILRLFELGASPISLGASLKIGSSQRLLRNNCEYCRTKSSEVNIASKNISWESKGCEKCNFTGSTKRIAIYETCEPTLGLISELGKIHKEGFSNNNKEIFETHLKASNFIPFSNSLKELLLNGEISEETASTLYF
jgi:type II secretory ATPase GspE/PulE/Tfp pilus assembly ATPase PilB-like protein